MDTLALVGDVLAVAGFVIASAIVFATPSDTGGPFDPLTKWLMFFAFLTRGYVSATKVWAHFAGPNVFEEFGDYIEVLFPVLVVMSVFSAFAVQKNADLASSARVVQATSSMMLDMVDAAPAGILVLDGAGHITFANESAREVLDLIDDPETGGVATPGWRVVDPSGVGMDDFSFLIADTSPAPVPVRVEWPNTAWRVDILVSVRPLSEDLGRSGGVVATFSRPAARP